MSQYNLTKFQIDTILLTPSKILWRALAKLNSITLVFFKW